MCTQTKNVTQTTVPPSHRNISTSLNRIHCNSPPHRAPTGTLSRRHIEGENTSLSNVSNNNVTLDRFQGKYPPLPLPSPHRSFPLDSFLTKSTSRKNASLSCSDGRHSPQIPNKTATAIEKLRNNGNESQTSLTSLLESKTSLDSCAYQADNEAGSSSNGMNEISTQTSSKKRLINSK